MAYANVQPAIPTSRNCRADPPRQTKTKNEFAARSRFASDLPQMHLSCACRVRFDLSPKTQWTLPELISRRPGVQQPRKISLATANWALTLRATPESLPEFPGPAGECSSGLAISCSEENFSL